MTVPPDADGRRSLDDDWLSAGERRSSWEVLRPLELGRDLALEGSVDRGDGAAPPSTAYLLDEQGQWAIIIPAGSIVHVHEVPEGDAVLFECEEIAAAGAPAAARCTECGATIPVPELEQLIDRHPHLAR